MQKVVSTCLEGKLDAEPRVVISNNSKSGAIAFARNLGIPAHHLSSRTHTDPDELDRAICETLLSHDADLVLLVGYNKLLGKRTLTAYRGRILNTHPAPLPQFGGRGMYGIRVHEAVLASGIAKTAVSIHLVDEEYDRGRLLSAIDVEVLAEDTPETLAARVRSVEGTFLIETLRRIVRGEIALPKRELTHGLPT